MEMKIHHIGYIVKNLDRAADKFQQLGFVVDKDFPEAVLDEYRKIKILFLQKDGYRIELVCPTDKTTKIADMARRVGNSPYHICYSVASIQEGEAYLKENGYVLCDEAHEAIAFGNKRVCFYIHPFLGMVELVEE